MKHLVRMLLMLSFGLSALGAGSASKASLNVEAGLGYNSNPYSLTDLQKGGRSVGDLVARVAPGFSLNTQGRKLALNVGANANMGALFGLNGNPGFLVFSGGASGGSTYNPNGSVSFFTQGGLASSRSLGELFVGNLSNLTGKAVLGSTIRPGQGKVSLTVQGEYQVQGYPGLSYQNQSSVPQRLNNQSYYLAARLAWQFLPKTGLYAEGRYGFFENIDASNNNVTINPLWVGGGLMGQITPTLSANISAHFSKIFIRNGAQTFASTSIPFGAKVGLDWNFRSHSSFGVGLGREISPAPIFLDQASTSLMLKYNQTMWEKLSFSLSPQGGVLEYGKPYTAAAQYRTQDGTSNRFDFYTGVQVGLAYSLNSWCAFGISGEGFWRWTNTDPAKVLDQTGWVATGDGSNYSSLFSRYQGNAFVRLTY